MFHPDLAASHATLPAGDERRTSDDLPEPEARTHLRTRQLWVSAAGTLVRSARCEALQNVLSRT